MDYKEAYNKLLNAVVKDDNASVTTIEKAQEINDQIKETPSNKGQTDKQQKKEIMSIRDSTERQQAIKENIHLFK